MISGNRSLPSGNSFFTGFSRLSKGLAAILFIGFVVFQLFPSTNQYLALIPGKTIPFVWNLVTAGYFEQSVFGLILSILGLLFCGKLLEPVWGGREFLKFVMIVNIFASVSVFITNVALYYVTKEEAFLYTPLSGFHAVLSGFLVGLKQIMPDHDMTVLYFLKLRVKWLPSILVLLVTVVSILVMEVAAYLSFVFFGTYVSWLYLRYFQTKPETILKGDPSDEFSFSTFFPEILRSAIDPACTLCEKIFCWGSQTSSEGRGQVLEGLPLPGSDPVEASRRRERGARALEERLAAAKSNEPTKASEKSSEDASANV